MKNTNNSNENVREKQKTSAIRRKYIFKLAGRCIVLAACIWLFMKEPGQFAILNGMNFFTEFSVLHLLWAIWMMDMIFQIVPVGKQIPLGSQKHFLSRLRLTKEKINYQALRSYIISTTKAAYKVFVLWALLLAVIGAAYYCGQLKDEAVFLISVLFYVCDLICVLIWCPFRLMMKNRCCTTCRIFNWDHWMMFSPLIFVGGFYCWSLVVMAIIAWLVWEVCVMMYPERFWFMTNEALRCSECTDKLCTQYCRKLRRKG